MTKTSLKSKVRTGGCISAVLEEIGTRARAEAPPHINPGPVIFVHGWNVHHRASNGDTYLPLPPREDFDALLKEPPAAAAAVLVLADTFDSPLCSEKTRLRWGAVIDDWPPAVAGNVYMLL